MKRWWLLPLGLTLSACSDDPIAAPSDTSDVQDLSDGISEPDTQLPDTSPEPDTQLPDTSPEPDTQLPDTSPEPDTQLPDTSPEPDTQLPDTSPEPDTQLPDTSPEPDTELPDTSDVADSDTDDADVGPEPDTTVPDDDFEDPYVAECGFELPTLQWRAHYDLDEETLRDTLQEYLSEKRGLDYGVARDYMYKDRGYRPEGYTGTYTGIDVAADGYITCLYTGLRFKADGSNTPKTDNRNAWMNTEHSWPRSDGAASYPREGDIFHLFPTEQVSNSSRGNHEFGYTNCGQSGQSSCTWAAHGSKLGAGTDGRAKVFEVRPDGRGDIARAHFYFSVVYGLAITPQEELVLREWNCQDPPDAKEKARNDDIERVVGVRNPFVDAPSLVYRISNY